MNPKPQKTAALNARAPLTRKMNIRLGPELRERLQRVAKAIGISEADFVRAAVDRVIHDASGATLVHVWIRDDLLALVKKEAERLGVEYRTFMRDAVRDKVAGDSALRDQREQQSDRRGSAKNARAKQASARDGREPINPNPKTL